MSHNRSKDDFAEGRCRESGKNELFFSEEAGDLAKAQSICAECVIRVRCLEYALEESVEWGVWGGVVFWDGQAYHRKRGRGRPRKAEASLPIEASREELELIVRSA